MIQYRCRHPWALLTRIGRDGWVVQAEYLASTGEGITVGLALLVTGVASDGATICNGQPLHSGDGDRLVHQIVSESGLGNEQQLTLLRQNCSIFK